MPEIDDPNYFGREQSLVKHIILENYLKRFAIIVGQFWDQITYIDCFSGPWNARSSELKDASFAIALKELRSARDVIRARFNRELKIQCLFLEKDKVAFEILDQFTKKENTEHNGLLKAINEEFEYAIPQVLDFFNSGDRRSFAFLFIDPTGWTGFSMPVIQPLIKLKSAEVLVNFMTSFIVRFIKTENPTLEDGFQKLFGTAKFKARLSGLTGRDLEDALVFAYAERLAEVGDLKHFAVTIVPHPEKDRTHFHLIYATRNLRGIEVFKNAEGKAVKGIDQLRTNAKQRRKESMTNQPDLFNGESLPETDYITSLKVRYASMARNASLEFLRQHREVKYDDLFSIAMKYPMVQEPDLRNWIADIASIDGLAAGERVPKIGKAHRVKMN